MKSDREPALVAVVAHCVKPLRQLLGVAVLATGADLGTSRHWIPSRLSPFDVAVVGHNISQLQTQMACGP